MKDSTGKFPYCNRKYSLQKKRDGSICLKSNVSTSSQCTSSCILKISKMEVWSRYSSAQIPVKSCGGWSENVLHGLCLNTCYSWWSYLEGLRGVILLEEVCHRRLTFESLKTQAISSSLCFLLTV